MDCIAEGVETEEQRDLLQELGCDVFQGYLCGRPMELTGFKALLRDFPGEVGEQAHQRSTPPTFTPMHHPLIGVGSSVPST